MPVEPIPPANIIKVTATNKRARRTSQRSTIFPPRPYRSHKQPACTLCRKRKARCVAVSGDSCYFCLAQGVACTLAQNASNEDLLQHQGSGTSGSQVIDSAIRSAGTVPLSKSSARRISLLQNSQNSRSLDSTEAAISASVLVGPVSAHDAQVVEQYMTAHRINTSTQRNPYGVYSDNPQRPILYTTIARKREGSRVIQVPGSKQLEVVEQILGASIKDIIQL